MLKNRFYRSLPPPEAGEAAVKNYILSLSPAGDREEDIIRIPDAPCRIIPLSMDMIDPIG